ncbi:protein lin-9 homolog [Centruroides sculpturatus]|uniref:protein lin-9 homolog n=1 Tax=Centruroides sculpturatus TaxID=218467 RepID=UPI000C6E6394|nr:protein lin-9 homolog [Centruroides sculpturatus]
MADSLESESAAALLSMKDAGRANRLAVSPNRRGNPPRTRKRNRLIFNEDEDTSYSFSRSSPRKTPRVTSPSVSSAVVPDKRAAHRIGLRLRNLLKLPKAHKWVCHEWFYSNIDQPLFLGDNEFCICLRESFPQLKSYKLTRVEWCKIRRLMGKPRRCSSAFFQEERSALQTKRNKIRQLQQRKVVDLANFRDLPAEIPLPLVIGTKATARLRKPQDGLFTGSIDAVDTSNATYRITFDRPGLGTHSIPDFEVLSNDPSEMMPISAFAQKHRPRNIFYTPPRFGLNSAWPQLDNDPLLGGSSLQSDLSLMEEGTLGGFPKKFLVLLVRLSKILAAKKEKITWLKEMNTEAEKLRSYQEPIPLEFQKQYASVILEFEKLNKDLDEYLTGVQQYCQEIAPEQGLQPVVQPEVLRQQCLNNAKDTVNQANRVQGVPLVENERIVELVSHLTSLMIQVKNLAENDLNSFEFKSLSDSLVEIQVKLEPQNISVFQNNVEIHINHIQSGLGQMGNLHAFATQNIQIS